MLDGARRAVYRNKTEFLQVKSARRFTCDTKCKQCTTKTHAVGLQKNEQKKCRVSCYKAARACHKPTFGSTDKNLGAKKQNDIFPNELNFHGARSPKNAVRKISFNLIATKNFFLGGAKATFTHIQLANTQKCRDNAHFWHYICIFLLVRPFCGIFGIHLQQSVQRVVDFSLLLRCAATVQGTLSKQIGNTLQSVAFCTAVTASFIRRIFLTACKIFPFQRIQRSHETTKDSACTPFFLFQQIAVHKQIHGKSQPKRRLKNSIFARARQQKHRKIRRAYHCAQHEKRQQQRSVFARNKFES